MEALHLPFFWTALAAGLVLAGIHAYLGFHIVRRGVIFVDLALTVGWIFGFAGCLLGLLAAVHFDLPAAPSILVSLTALLALWGGLIRLRRLA